MTVKTSMGNITAKMDLLFILSVALSFYADELEKDLNFSYKRHKDVAMDVMLALDNVGYYDKKLERIAAYEDKYINRDN